MKTEFLRFNGAIERDPAIDAWMQTKMQTQKKEHTGELGAIAHHCKHPAQKNPRFVLFHDAPKPNFILFAVSSPQ